MALQVWLPLNGDLTNQGLSNVTVTNNGATVDNNGKIGKCYNLTNGPITVSNIQQSKAISIAFWFKRTANTGTRQFMFTAWNGVTCELTTSGAPTFAVYKSSYPTITGANITDTTTWYHYCGTFSETDGMKLYINGKLIASDNNKNPIQWNTTSGQIGKYASYASMSALINDFRIYDHALSAKEVGELAKGLVLHYRLAGPGQENLITGNFSCTSTNTIYKSQGTVDCVLTAADLMANQGRTLTLSYDVYSLGDYTQNTAGSWQADRFGIHGFVNYTKSGSSTSTQDYPLANLLSRGKNGRVFTSWKIPTGVTSFNTDLGFSIQTNGRDGYAYPASNNSSTWYLKNIKLEWGSIVTPWCPNPADALYSAMGYNDNIEYDCSGYRRNGTKSGNIIWDIDSPRYTTSYKLNGTTVDTTSNTAIGAAYVVGPCQMPSTSNITIVWWDKINKYGRGGIFETTSATSDFQNASDYNTTAFANWDTIFGIYNGTTRINIFNQIKIDSNWHHYAITYNGVNVIVYRDGVEVQKSALTGNLPAFNGIKIGLGKAGGVYRQINKNTSDFRIYATALSAEDIAELYHSAVIVDNTGKNYAYEYFEG